MPTYAEIVSTLALVISCGSLVLGVVVAGRDRARLRITARFVEASQYGPNRVLLKFVNLGRRPVILRMLGGTSKEGKWSATFLEREKGGLRLGENEMYEHKLDKDDTVTFHPEGDDLFYDRLWVEDSLGRRHKIPASQTLIKRLWQ